jgi:hypothetical protein
MRVRRSQACRSDRPPRNERSDDMPDETRRESADLEDYDVDSASDTLTGEPGDEPLDRGVAPPEHWSAAMKFGATAEEQETGESLDQLLAEEEPDVEPEIDDERLEDEDADGLLLDDGPDPRAGRLVAEDEGTHAVIDGDLVAQDAGIDGAGASAEEAAVHVVEDDDNDVRSGD